jgi:ppGpp synthetase/RelA/SpoT-type nucleotidyltranferase
VTSFEAKEEGYYAAHISVLQNFAVPGPSWDSTNINVWIEIQITTQLQEVYSEVTS